MYKNNLFLKVLKISTMIVMIVSSINIQASNTNKKLNKYQPPSSLPSELALVDYEKQLYEWVLKFNYKKLPDWKVDQEVRDTGPFLDQKDYGTHGAVRIFYSPETLVWLKNGREGPLADGAIIIKEMYTPPAAIYQELSKSREYNTDGKTNSKYEAMLESVLTSWVIMVKDSNLSADGWFWGSVEIKQEGKTIKQSIDSYEVDTLKNRGTSQLRWSGAAMPCIRCHASAKSEMTFLDEENINGNPLVFRTDDSWRTKSYFESHSPLSNIKDNEYVLRFMNTLDYKGHTSTTGMDYSNKSNEALNLDDHSLRNNAITALSSANKVLPNKLFLSTFSPFPHVAKNDVITFPPQWMDHVVMPGSHDESDNNIEHITSDNCVGCHGGLSGGINREVMFVANTKYRSKMDQRTKGYNVSEYGEWRWSPMGLAGRDPIFHAQLESEMNLLIRDHELDEKNKNQPNKLLLKGPLAVTQKAVTNKCLTCHGAMGQRQLSLDAKKDSKLKDDFKVSYFYLKEAVTEEQIKQQQKDGTHQYAKYGALAREGISCMICHHIDGAKPEDVKSWNPKDKSWLGKNLSKEEKTLAYNLFHHSSGDYRYGPSDEVFGPFDDVKNKPMEHSLNLSPVHNEYIQDSQMCGNCHTINLPNIGSTIDKYPVLTAAADPSFPAFKDYNHTIEQATFVEWQNSSFSVKPKPNQKPKVNTFASCQDCHMANNFTSLDGRIKVNPIVTQIASIQDSSYPAAGESLQNQEINIPVRDDYRRHTHVGLNVFLLSMMEQFGEQFLGLGKSDYMTGANTGAQFALENMIQQAQSTTANIDIGDISVDYNKDNNTARIKTAVKVTNKTGHRYPSGVAFRRAFLEFTIKDAGGKILWQSGGTNGVGVITNHETGLPLSTEFLPSTGAKKPQKEVEYQPHYQIISKPSQVQIYEELNLNAQYQFTTSFVHRVHTVKDNRLLPRGWKESKFFKSQGEVIQQFMAATDPEEVGNDPDYMSHDDLKFPGQDNLIYDVKVENIQTFKRPLTVNVTLYNQSIPPYWLNHRFTESPKGFATQRLYYMASRLNLDNTAMENWKLKLVSDKKRVPVFSDQK